jgi:hypothetical protein
MGGGVCDYVMDRKMERALLVCEFLANHNLFSLPHPAYSPDLAPADFFLLLKMQLKGRRFHTVANIQRESQTTTHK